MRNAGECAALGSLLRRATRWRPSRPDEPAGAARPEETIDAPPILGESPAGQLTRIGPLQEETVSTGRSRPVMIPPAIATGTLSSQGAFVGVRP